MCRTYTVGTHILSSWIVRLISKYLTTSLEADRIIMHFIKTHFANFDILQTYFDITLSTYEHQ